MPDAFEMHFSRIKAELDDARRRLSESAPLEDNREAIKTLTWVFLNNLAGLVDAGGGETIYIPDPNYLSDDIERAFSDPIEEYDAKEGRGLAPKIYGTMDRRTLGLSGGARA